jgi:hypothetical protein
MLKPAQVRGSFATDLEDYIVVEVAVFPKTGSELELSASDFTLRVAAKETIRTANPKAIAANLQRRAGDSRGRSGSDVTIYPTVGVGHGRWPGGSGTHTSVGVGVGIGGGPDGPPAPASTDADRNTMEAELTDKSLPQGLTANPVAGYLYFPAPKKRTGAIYELEYSGLSEKITLQLK